MITVPWISFPEVLPYFLLSLAVQKNIGASTLLYPPVILVPLLRL
jgi:hypothetical protein